VRIGIDARELCGRPTGVGRYLSGLLDEWAASDHARGHEFVLYSPEPLAVARDGRRFATHLVPGPGGTWWEQVRMPARAARDDLDVFFAPAYTAPLFRRAPMVVTIHDVSFQAHPEWFAAREGIRRRWLSRQAALGARSVITISQFSRRELVDRFGVVESSIHVIPPGVTPPPASAAVACGGGANALYVGSIFNRRHVPHLIRAFAPIARRHPHASLDIVGDNRSYPPQDLSHTVALEGLTGRVRWRAWVTDEELGTLFGAARAFAFLSEYEGLGLPPLEALAAQVPPLLLDTPVARESCGDAALYVSLDDLAGTTLALEQLLFDEVARARILTAAPRVLARYSWPQAARETLDVLTSAPSAVET
jgi:glycosyltransferase involved in cell wall biosynthesis